MPHKSWRGVFELGKLYLKLSLSAYRVEREYIKYQHRTVNDSDLIPHDILYIPYLRGRKIAVEDHKGCVVTSAEIGKLRRLSASYKRSRIGSVLVLRKSCDSLTARGIKQTLKLVKALMKLLLALASADNSHKHGFVAHIFIVIHINLHQFSICGGITCLAPKTSRRQCS